jgi:hypothetical protein
MLNLACMRASSVIRVPRLMKHQYLPRIRARKAGETASSAERNNRLLLEVSETGPACSWRTAQLGASAAYVVYLFQDILDVSAPKRTIATSKANRLPCQADRQPMFFTWTCLIPTYILPSQSSLHFTMTQGKKDVTRTTCPFTTSVIN